ncbi:MAG: DUF3649 domain-containing protein [Verrucomicrobiae bacterium]|nr:DUF3649 domain-containing protein [Verrucomicrobiae bacterium]
MKVPTTRMRSWIHGAWFQRFSGTFRILGVVLRVMAGIGGGYLFAQILSAYLAVIAPLPKEEAVMSVLMLSFLFYLFAILWAFSVRTVWQAWLGVLVPSALFGAGAWWLQ